MGWPAFTRWPSLARMRTTRPSDWGRITTLEVDSMTLIFSMPGAKRNSPTVAV